MQALFLFFSKKLFAPFAFNDFTHIPQAGNAALGFLLLGQFGQRIGKGELHAALLVLLAVGLALHLGQLEEVAAVLSQLLLGEVAGQEVTGLDLTQLRRHALALFAGHVAAGVELAACRRICR